MTTYQIILSCILSATAITAVLIINGFKVKDEDKEPIKKRTMKTSKNVISKQFAWNWRDLIKGLVVATLTPVIPYLSSGAADLKAMGFAALGGFAAYMLTNFFQPTTIVKTNPDAIDIEKAKRLNELNAE